MTITSWSGGTGRYGLLVHGGAGDVSLERRERHGLGCRSAAEAAREILARGGPALDAVQRAVELLEDDPAFNAGTGASLTEDGTLELDAAIMAGHGLRAGAVCGLPPFKNPIAIARAALGDGRHVLYVAEGAARFAQQTGFVPAPAADMITDAARASLAQVLAGRAPSSEGQTVGAVARDRSGHVAAATSTGGIAGKRSGRIGDSPIFGAGTYADDTLGAASATGQGEGILRVLLTTRLLDSLQGGFTAEQACRYGIQLLAERAGTTGGVIAVTTAGRLAFARSTATMSWAAAWDGAETIHGT